MKCHFITGYNLKEKLQLRCARQLLDLGSMFPIPSPALDAIRDHQWRIITYFNFSTREYILWTLAFVFVLFVTWMVGWFICFMSAIFILSISIGGLESNSETFVGRTL